MFNFRIFKLVFILGFLSVIVNAAEDDNGIDEAYKLCGKMPYETDSKQCLKTVSSAKALNFEAVGFCSKFSYVSEINNCLLEIKDKYYQSSLIAVCNKMIYSTDRMQCIKLVANKSANENAIAVCGQRPYSSQIISCIQDIVTNYVPPPEPPPTESCKKDFVMTEFDTAFKDLSENKIMSSYQRLLNLKMYLYQCLK